jgi:hypothetical protein
MTSGITGACIRRLIFTSSNFILVLFMGRDYVSELLPRTEILFNTRWYGLESDGGMIFSGENQTTRRRACPSATLSTTNPTWIGTGANTGLRGKRPRTNRLSHGTAKFHTYCQ